MRLFPPGTRVVESLEEELMAYRTSVAAIFAVGMSCIAMPTALAVSDSRDAIVVVQAGSPGSPGPTQPDGAKGAAGSPGKLDAPAKELVQKADPAKQIPPEIVRKDAPLDQCAGIAIAAEMDACLKRLDAGKKRP